MSAIPPRPKGRGIPRKMMNPNHLWEKRIKAIRESGFNLVSQNGAGNGLSDIPDAVLVGQEGTELSGAILCLDKDDASNAIMHLATEGDFTQEQLDELASKDAFFYESEPGRHSGFVPLRMTDYPLGSDVPYEDIKQELDGQVKSISEIGLTLTDLKLKGEYLQLLPFFDADKPEPTEMSDKDLYKALGAHLKEQISQVELTEQQRALLDPSYTVDNDPGVSERYKLKPNMAPSAG